MNKKYLQLSPVVLILSNSNVGLLMSHHILFCWCPFLIYHQDIISIFHHLSITRCSFNLRNIQLKYFNLSISPKFFSLLLCLCTKSTTSLSRTFLTSLSGFTVVLSSFTFSRQFSCLCSLAPELKQTPWGFGFNTVLL